MSANNNDEKPGVVFIHTPEGWVEKPMPVQMAKNLRDEFAMAALPTAALLVQGALGEVEAKNIATISYFIADAMMKARAVKP